MLRVLGQGDPLHGLELPEIVVDVAERLAQRGKVVSLLRAGDPDRNPLVFVVDFDEGGGVIDLIFEQDPRAPLLPDVPALLHHKAGQDGPGQEIVFDVILERVGVVEIEVFRFLLRQQVGDEQAVVIEHVAQLELLHHANDVGVLR